MMTLLGIVAMSLVIQIRPLSFPVGKTGDEAAEGGGRLLGEGPLGARLQQGQADLGKKMPISM